MPEELRQDFTNRYLDWLTLVIENQNGFTYEDKAKFNDFCNEWTGYPGAYDSSFISKLLNEYFEGIPEILTK